MSKPYKDRIVNTTDGLPRFKIVNDEGEVFAEGVKIELDCEVTQEADDFGADEINMLIERDDDGTKHANFVPLAKHCDLDEPITLSTDNYGTTLPAEAAEGRLFFKIGG